MPVDSVQLMIDYFGTIPEIAALVGSRVWFNNEIPAAVEYNPGQGPAILISRRGGRTPFILGLKDPSVSVRVYGADRPAIFEVCDMIDTLHARQRPRTVGVLDVDWQDDSEPSTGWLFSFSLWTMRLRIA
jgi:hypothetical protein